MNWRNATVQDLHSRIRVVIKLEKIYSTGLDWCLNGIIEARIYMVAKPTVQDQNDCQAHAANMNSIKRPNKMHTIDF